LSLKLEKLFGGHTTTSLCLFLEALHYLFSFKPNKMAVFLPVICLIPHTSSVPDKSRTENAPVGNRVHASTKTVARFDGPA
jgi:hypothetical protein